MVQHRLSSIKKRYNQNTGLFIKKTLSQSSKQKKLIPFFIHRRAVNERLFHYLSHQKEILDNINLQETSLLYENLTLNPNLLSKPCPPVDKTLFVKELNPYAAKRIEMFMFVFDIEILVSFNPKILDCFIVS